MDALRIREFFFKSNNELPNRSVSIKDDSFVFINLQSLLFRVLERLIRSSSNKGQWRTAMRVNTVLKIVIQFTLTQMPEPQTKQYHQSNSFVVVTVKKLLGVGLINLKILILKIPKLSSFQMEGSSLFHPMTAPEKKVFLKKLCLILIRGIQSTFLQHKDFFPSIKSNYFYKFCKIANFLYHCHD